jgi:hypothetical protein
MKGKISTGIMVGVSIGVILFVGERLNKYEGRYDFLDSGSAVIDLSSSGRSDPNVSGVKNLGVGIGKDLDIRFMGYDSDGIVMKRLYVKKGGGEYELRAEEACGNVNSFGEIKRVPWNCLKQGTYNLKFEIEDTKGNKSSDLARLVVE